MFSSTPGAQSSELAMYRLTDLHQPQSVSLLATPVPKCPEDGKMRGMDSWDDTPESLQTENVPEVTIKEVLNLLERVDIGFIKRRTGSAGNAGKAKMTPLMGLFEERSPNIFDIHKSVKICTWVKRAQPDLHNSDARSPKIRKSGSHKKSTDTSDPNKSSDSVLVKTKPRVSLNDAGASLVGNSLNKEEEEGLALESIKSIFNVYLEKANAAGDEDMAPGEALNNIQSLSSNVLRMSSHVKAFKDLSRETLSSVVDHLSGFVLRGSGVLLSESQSEKSEEYVRVLSALEAIILIQRLSGLVSNAMVVSEETLESCIEVTRFHLHSNVLPFYDAKIRTSVRPDISVNSKKSGGGKQAYKAKLLKAIQDLGERILIALDLISSIASTKRAQIPTMTPLIRTAIQSITVESLPEMRSKAVRLLSSIYFAYPDLRQSMLHDIFVALTPFLGVGRKLKRDLLIASGDGGMKSVNVMSALIVHIIQSCAHFPTDSSIESTKAEYSTCVNSADWFWELCMERLVSAKTMKMETDADFACALQGIVYDILEISSSVYWPCASLALIRLVSIINGPMGLQNQDPFVRQTCVDLIGKILSFVHKDSVLLNESTERFEEILQEIDYDTISDAAVDLTLSYLAESDVESVSSAEKFLSLQKLCERYAKLEGTMDDSTQIEEAFAKVYIETSEKLKQRRRFMCDGLIDEEDAGLIMKVIVHEQFLSAAPAMLSWLLDIITSKNQSSSVRSKVVRALGDIVSVDKRLLDINSMLAAIEQALQDDSISVREAALVLVGKHMVQDSSLAMRLLHVVIKSADDPGSSVRRSAIRILRDCALVIPKEHGNKTIDAYRAILNRSTDSEESVKSAVAKIFKSLWFDPIVEGEDGLRIQRSASDRAQSLADLSNAIVTCIPSNTSGVRSLLDRSNPLVVLLTDMYEDYRLEKSKDKKVREDAYLETSTALLDGFIYCKDRRLPYLYAIYSMVLANPSSCIPESDPLKFLRTMAPQIRTLSSAQPGDVEGTEEVLYVLSIISAILKSMEESRMLVMDLATEISEELPNLINTHKFTVIVSAACACLASCALSSPTATGRFLNITAQYMSFLESHNMHARNLPRFIFILGQLYRNGARLLQQVDLYLPDQPSLAQKLKSESCLKLLLGFWSKDIEGSPGLAAQVQRNSLEAICQVMISCPWLALDADSGVQGLLSEALLLKSPPLVRLAALNGLIELLEADAYALNQRQSADSRGVDVNSNNSAQKPAVAAENGDGECSHASAVLQNHWEAILILAAECPPNRNNEEQSYGITKKRILSLMEIAIRDGLVGPWTAVPTLVLLTMDTLAGQDSIARSIKLLKFLSSKYPQYVDAVRLSKGVKDAYVLYIKDALRKNRDKSNVMPDRLRQTQARLKRLYSEIVNTNRSKRNEFLRLLVRSFKKGLMSTQEVASRRLSSGADDASYPPSMWPCLAILISGLPYTKTEEVCVVVHEIDAITASKVPSTVAELHEFIESDTPVTHPTVKQCASRAKLLLVLVRLKNYLMNGYNIAAERQAVYSAGTKRSTGGTTKLAGDGLLNEPVHFNARLISSNQSGLYNIFASTEDAETSQIVPSALHPVSQGPTIITPLVTLRELYEELDSANEAWTGDGFDPDDQ